VQDNLAPTIDNCADQSADAIDGTCEYIVSGSAWDATATDACTLTLTNDYTGTETLDGASFPTGTTTVTWTATDEAGNTATCSHDVVISNADLAADCRSYINTNTLTLGDDGTLTMVGADFNDASGSACDDLSYTFSVDGGASFVAANTFTCADLTFGTPMTIVLLATDNATGETDACIAQLSLTDTPVLVDFGGCPSDVTTAAGAGLCGADVSLPLPIVDGACPVISYSVDGGASIVADGSDVYFGIGTHTVDFSITNASGDAAIVLGGPCSIIVTVTGDASNPLGCTDPLAANFDPVAVCDDNSCIYGPAACITVNDLPYGEDFEGTTGQWSQEASADDIDWDLNTGATPTDGTGPDAASSGDQYLYVEASYPNYSSTAIINSPCFDLLESNESSFSFAYNMNGEGVGSLDLELSVNGTDYVSVWNQTGDQGSEWQEATVDLSNYDDEMLVLRFNGETTNEYDGDIAIDQFGFNAQDAPETCGGDITGNGVVDINDFVALNSVFGTSCEDCPEDINNDGQVDVNDFLAFNSQFGSTCGETVDGPVASLAQQVFDFPGIELNKDLEEILRDMAELNFIVYPNPTAGENINIHINDFVGQDEVAIVSVKDVSGRVLTAERLIGTQTGITHQVTFTDQLASGV
jgi:hypothetical protein